MSKKRNWRAIFTWALFGFSVLYIIPSVVDVPQWWPFKKEVRGGLDLAGGLELRYTVDWKTAIENSTRKNAETIQANVATALAKTNNENYADLSRDAAEAYRSKAVIKVEDLDRATVTLADEATWNAFKSIENLQFIIDERYDVSSDAATRVVTLALPDRTVQEIRRSVVAETRDHLEKRVGGLGLIDPDVRVTGDSDVAVQVPGVTVEQMDVVRSVLGRAAQLSMRFVDPSSFLLGPDVAQKIADFKTANPDVQSLEQRASSAAIGRTDSDCSIYGGTIKSKSKGELIRFTRTLELPEGHMLGYEYCEAIVGGTVTETYWQAVYLHSKVEIMGTHLRRARLTMSQTNNRPAVSLDFNGEGASLFAEATGRNIGAQLAILLDEDIQSAPVIQTKIAEGRAEITMGRSSVRAQREAEALAEVLNQGAYQAPVYKVHDHEVGPSLGSDSVTAGALSLAVGYAFIFAFLVFYYRKSGLIAALVLGFNVLLVFVLLIAFGTALTLPGIAGIVLTIGMSIDANIIIYERIREELRLGKTPRVAVDLGYEKAFSAILDGNITTAIVGLVLMNFTSGPIHNFAVTLLLGIVTSVFTAVVVSRLMFNWWLAAKKPTTLSI